jgi:hypothetical protein
MDIKMSDEKPAKLEVFEQLWESDEDDDEELGDLDKLTTECRRS